RDLTVTGVQTCALPISGEEQSARGTLKKIGADLGAVEFFVCRTDRAWTRDYCPLFVRNREGEVAITNWHFNGWAKYDNWKKDDAIPGQIARVLKMRQCRPVLV